MQEAGGTAGDASRCPLFHRTSPFGSDQYGGAKYRHVSPQGAGRPVGRLYFRHRAPRAVGTIEYPATGIPLAASSRTSGNITCRQARVRQVCRRASQHLVLLFHSRIRFFARSSASSAAVGSGCGLSSTFGSHPPMQPPLCDAEVGSDLLDPLPRLTVAGNVTTSSRNSPRIGPGHRAHPSSGAPQIRCHRIRGAVPGLRWTPGVRRSVTSASHVHLQCG